VREAEPGDAISAGCVLVAPGAGSLVVKREGTALKVDIVPPQPEDRYVPSVDRMLTSCAAAMGADLCAIVLTGMGGDGGRGIKAVKAAGGRTLAEAPETAVIFGMPQEAIATGAVDDVVPLPNIPERIARFAQKK
jgi:two-component system chemotaxis response regulator CheB